jgi:hypothetical protein
LERIDPLLPALRPKQKKRLAGEVFTDQTPLSELGLNAPQCLEMRAALDPFGAGSIRLHPAITLAGIIFALQ